MSYIRTRGNQLLLVHGFRDKAGKANQQVLFTIFSKPEALEILGEGKSGGNPDYFRFLIEGKYPLLKFDWSKLKKSIKDQMNALPDFYHYKQERVQNGFKKNMAGFFRQLAFSDPQSTLSAAQIYQDNKYELEFISELIMARLLCAENQKANDFNGDNPFYWRQHFRMFAPDEMAEMALMHLNEMKYDRVEAIFKLLVDVFENYAEGYNHLGFVALEKGDLNRAAVNFKEAVLLGRKKFPKRISKDRYWSDIDTRPYIRGLRNLSLVLNRLGKFDEALEVCCQLESECGDDLPAASTASYVYLNKGEWMLALKKSTYCSQIFKEMSFNVAFALLEMGDTEGAKKYFLHGALNYPYTAHALIGLKERELKKYVSLTVEEAHDPDVVWEIKANIFKYLSGHKRKIKNHFGKWLTRSEIQGLIFERAEAMNKWKVNQGDGTSEGYKKMMRMGDLRFAERFSKKPVLNILQENV